MNWHHPWRGGLALALGLLGAERLAATARAADPGVVKLGFVAEAPPTASSHASTIVELPEGMLAAWFGGTAERALDVGIWLARHSGDGWSAPEEVATGVVPKQGQRYPCWNPVLFRRMSGEVLLFYKVGPNPIQWWGMVRSSLDDGQTWTRERRLPSGFVGPVRNKPIELADGTLLCGSSTEDKGWRIHLEWTKDPFSLWNRGPELNAAITCAAIQPTLVRYRDGFQILCRTKQGRIYETRSKTGLEKWSPVVRTVLPNPNSAVDAVLLRDGRALLVYNHSRENRNVLNVAVSEDGVNWQAACEIEKDVGGELSYPAVIQTQDGLVHVTYTWKRERIRHAVLDPQQFQLRPMPDGQWR
jgi:predicted neuraminidase